MGESRASWSRAYATVETWSRTADARRRARVICRCRRAGLAEQDVIDDALARFWRRAEKSTNPAPDDPINYMTAMMKNIVTNAHRAWKKFESDEQADTVADPGHIGPGDDWEPAPIDARSELIRNLGLAAAVRAALETADASSADRSAALTFLALSDDGMNPRALDDDVPLPEAGARPDQARYWPAIWFAERDDRIFGASQSVRRRRSRRIARVRDLVHWAIGRAEAVRHG